jgi:hypothetical protein
MRLGTVEVQFADHLVVEPYRDSGHTGHAQAGGGGRELRPAVQIGAVTAGMVSAVWGTTIAEVLFETATLERSRGATAAIIAAPDGLDFETRLLACD